GEISVIDDTKLYFFSGKTFVRRLKPGELVHDCRFDFSVILKVSSTRLRTASFTNSPGVRYPRIPASTISRTFFAKFSETLKFAYLVAMGLSHRLSIDNTFTHPLA